MSLPCDKPKFKVYLCVVPTAERRGAETIGLTAKRELSKSTTYHTDAIKQNLIPEEVTAAQASIIYAEEADVLNVAMFGQTAAILSPRVEREYS